MSALPFVRRFPPPQIAPAPKGLRRRIVVVRGAARHAEARDQSARPRRPDPVRRFGADLRRHGNSAWRSGLGHPSELCDARDARQDAARSRARPSCLPAILRVACSVRCTAISAIRSPMDAMSWRRSRRASPTLCSSRLTPRSSRCRSPLALGRSAAIRQGGFFDRLVNVVTLDDDLGARVFPRLYPDQICRGRPRLVSVARQRVIRYDVLRAALYHLPADADPRTGHRRAHDADDASFGARRHGKPLYRNGDSQGPHQVAHRRTPCTARTLSRRSSPLSRSTSPISSWASWWWRPCSSIRDSAS